MKKYLIMLVLGTSALLLSFACSKPPQVGQEYKLKDTKGGVMLYVPQGKFWMGCSKDNDSECNPDETPYREVNLKDFYIDKYEVTVNQYDECVQAGKCAPPGDGALCNHGKKDRPDHPVNCIDWNQAKSYCEWAGKRMPTEAEWEKAARGTDGRKYPWGKENASCDNTIMTGNGIGCGKNSTWPVGSKPKGKSAFGAMDMAGSVWEWVADFYGENYKGLPTDNPPGPSSGLYRVLRGGSWVNYANSMRSATRNKGEVTFKDPSYGVRCAKSL